MAKTYLASAVWYREAKRLWALQGVARSTHAIWAFGSTCHIRHPFGAHVLYEMGAPGRILGGVISVDRSKCTATPEIVEGVVLGNHRGWSSERVFRLCMVRLNLSCQASQASVGVSIERVWARPMRQGNNPHAPSTYYHNRWSPRAACCNSSPHDRVALAHHIFWTFLTTQGACH